MGGVVGAIIGGQQAEANRQAAQDAQQQALGLYGSLRAPSVAEQQLNFQQYQNAGNYNPLMEQQMQQGPNALAGIQTDPRLVQAQMSALNQLSTTGQMGMTPAEQAALNQAQQQAAAQAQAKNAQIVDQFARTGMGGSGAQLAAQLANSQGSAQMLANNSNQVMAQSGQLGGQMQGQEFGQKAQIAAAQNYINQFNTQNSQQVQAANTAAANQAALRNLNNQQNVMGQNTQLGNQQQQYNKQLLQQQYQNQLARASGMAGQYQGIANTQQQNAANTANQWAGIGQGVDTGIGAIYNSQNKSPHSFGGSYGATGASAGGSMGGDMGGNVGNNDFSMGVAGEEEGF